MRSDRVREQREDGKCEGGKSPETVAAEGGWKEPECPPQAGGCTTAPPTPANLILMHFLRRLRRKALITPALCTYYMIITKRYRVNAPPPPPFSFWYLEDLFSPHTSRWHCLSVVGEWAPTRRSSGTSQDGSGGTSSQSPWRLTSPLNLCKKRKHHSPRSISTSLPTCVTMRTRGPTVSFVFTVTPVYVCNSN